MTSLSLRTKRPRSSSPVAPERSAASSSQGISTTDTPTKAKKLKLQSSFVVESPFPDFGHPTPTEALEVFNLLSKAHPSHDPVRKPPAASSNSAQTCGNVPNVIESLIGTILSQNTSGKNSTRAKIALDASFGRNNFIAIAAAPHGDVADAIRSGGLANKKATTIQNVLKAIKDRHGDYSLQHLGAVEEGKRMSDDDIMKELISYDGVGPKTASCVLLFCLGRDSFAVDTHVFRLSKLLGWVPAKADRILTQAHLDLRIPDELKYGLHVLMIQHGRVCKGCKKSGSGESCILKTYLKEKKSQNEVQVETKTESADESDKT
ncbi:DNA glycosylase [Flammula alnicola]|nr:DNA glycosylase [Flammula alnicola]KAF8959290.1 DNA glycosylase [Flammula alnicola]